MAAFSGKFQYRDAGDRLLDQGACEVSFNTETCVITPAASAPMAFDLGDIDVAVAADYDLTLRLYNEKRIVLRQFGPTFGRMRDELIAAWRMRTVRCLLLEDLAELGRFNGAVNGAASEIRVYGSNLAVLPLAGKPFQRRLAEADSIRFDESAYAYTISFGAEKLSVAKLGPKTGEFGEKLRAAFGALQRHSAEALHLTFPFLSPDEVRALVEAAPEGRSLKLSTMREIHPDLPDALLSRVVDDGLRPYFESLRKRSVPDALMTGFKFVRCDEGGSRPGAPAAEEASEAEAATSEGGDSEAGTEAAAGEAGPNAAPPLFFWFFFPLPGRNVVAWEAATGSGRATYFFRAAEPVAESIGRLTRGLSLVNFRREPVYLPDASLDREAKYHRYAIGRRKLAELAELRAAFLGRAIHSSVDAWQHQVDEVIARA
jgi:hypothetical protein